MGGRSLQQWFRKLRVHACPFDKATECSIQPLKFSSTDRQLDRFADAAEHFHQRVDSELRRFIIRIREVRHAAVSEGDHRVVL